MPMRARSTRANYSEAVRVPNLFELYSPQQGARFRPADPCDAAQISSASDPGLRQANCIAALQASGVPTEKMFDANGNYIFVDPLSAGFPGVVGGNPDLKPEEATTKTIGFVMQPDWLENLTLSVDYWEIEINQAISEISAQNIVDSCYDAPSINNPFCDLISRVNSPTSAQAGGFNYLKQVQMNLGAAITEGYDFTAAYSFDVGPYTVGLVASGTKVNKLEFIEPTNPGEPPSIDNELGEARRPEWSGQFTANLTYEDLTLSWSTQYLGKQLLGYEDGAEIETAMQNFGPAAFTSEFFSHDLSASYYLNDQMKVYGGINNVTNEKPFVTEYAYPVSPVGRAFYMGLNYQF
jgi:iron complex outermembrane receptor protein